MASASERPYSTVSQVDSVTQAAYTPLPLSDGSSFLEHPPNPPFITHEGTESPRDSFVPSTPTDSRTFLPATHHEEAAYRDNDNDNEGREKAAGYPSSQPPSQPATKPRRRRLFILGGLLLLLIVIVAVIVPVYFTVIKPRKSTESLGSSAGSSAGAGSGHGGGATPTSTGAGGKTTPISNAAISGGDGSTIKASDGSSFTYTNQFGGIWWSDPNDPYNNNAYPNTWTPPLNQTWDYGQNRIYGVNLGGWFVLEPFISPALYQKYDGVIDEWTLSVAMAKDTANGGLNQIEDHYKTFITEQDFAEIAGAGLNWIRIPIPFWAIDKWGDEPFLEKVSWKYIVQAFQWARKYGLRVNLDLHTIPGSQNGFNHSGKDGDINFMLSTMGLANAQRALNYIRIITEFISQPEYRDVVPMFGIMNEPLIKTIGATELRGFYVEAYEMIRGITGVGEGKGPFISIHDGFQGLSRWTDFMHGADRIALDTHPYFAFDGSTSTAPIDTGVGPGAGGTWPQAACNRWEGMINQSRSAFGVTITGEWSNGFNDCGLFINGVGGGHSFGGDCSTWQDASTWTPGTVAGLLAFSSASMDALGDWFFWTWKIGNSTAGHVEAPLWSYKLGLEGGWITTDPRSALGACGPPTGPDFPGTFPQPWMTGGPGPGLNLPAAQTAQYPFPPANFEDGSGPISLLPLYTSTGTIATLPMPTYTDGSGKRIDPTGSGWFNAGDSQPGPAIIPGCDYPDPWSAVGAAIPTGCTGGAGGAVPAAITPPPT